MLPCDDGIIVQLMTAVDIIQGESSRTTVTEILLLADLAGSFISHFMTVMKYTADLIKYLGEKHQYQLGPSELDIL